MKTVGLIGGTSGESTIPCDRTINEVVKQRLGGLHAALLRCSTPRTSTPTRRPSLRLHDPLGARREAFKPLGRPRRDASLVMPLSTAVAGSVARRRP